MPTLSTYGDDGVAPLFFRVADRMRMEGYVSALIQDNMSLSIVSSHDAILDHYGKLLVARLREAAPHMGLEATEGVALLGEGELAPRRRFWQKSRLARQPLFCCALAVLAEQAVLRASMASRSAALPSLSYWSSEDWNSNFSFQKAAAKQKARRATSMRMR